MGASVTEIVISEEGTIQVKVTRNGVEQRKVIEQQQPEPLPEREIAKVIDIVPKEEKLGAKQEDRIDERPRTLFVLWNGLNPKKKLAKLSASMRQKIRTRLEDEPDMDVWKRCFEMVRDIEFLQKSNWCNLDWIMKNDQHYLKILSGNYGDKKNEAKPTEYFDPTQDLI